MIGHVQAIEADEKRLAVEESGMGCWIAQRLQKYLTEVVVCDPRHNHLISRHPHKCDEVDAEALARLYRLGELHRIWQPEQDHRAVFKVAVQGYLEAVNRQSALKAQLKAHYRQWGVIPVGSTVYSPRSRQDWLSKLPEADVRRSLELLYGVLDAAVAAEGAARSLMLRLGRRYPEIKRLRTVPGVGIIGAHVFVAFIQEPRRFETLARLNRYCRLGIRDRSSDNKPLGYQRLDRHGHGVLKAITYRAWLSGVRRQRGPVYEYYCRSLERTRQKVHARLNTQRQVLQTLWVLWQDGTTFEEKRFLGKAE